MSKILLFLVLAAVVWAWFRWRAGNKGKVADRPSAVSASMKQCRHCGVHFPGDEAVSAEGADFCCEEHRRLGPGR